jgi:alpha-tubulin suppressor-like RCC1 family protein
VVNTRWWLGLGLLVAAADCRLIAGYEPLELTPATATGGQAGTGDSGGGGSGGGGGGDAGSVVTIVSLTATPDHVVGAREVTIEWHVENATSCEFDEGLGQAAPYFGTKSVVPVTTTTYTLTCQGNGGPAEKDVLVTVLGVTMVAGNGFTCARLQSSAAKCFGNNAAGALGLGDMDNRGDAPGEMGDALPAIDLGQGYNVMTTAVGDGHACAVLSDNTVKCWGANGRGQLGLGDTSDRGGAPGEMGSALPNVTLAGSDALALGAEHSCARLLTGSVKCWGANESGQLGLGDAADRGGAPTDMQSLPTVDFGAGLTASAIAAGRAHSCALLNGGTVKCWGANDHGQLGQGDTNNRGDAPGEMGAALLPIDLGAGRTATALSARGDHTCALLDNSRIRCWGRNTWGQLGTGDPVDHGSSPGTMGDALPMVSLGTGQTAKAIAAGGSHSCVITAVNQVRCWGLNAHGQLGAGDTTDRGINPATMGDALANVDLGAQHTARAIAAGNDHTCAVIDDGTVRCWGGNPSGELGLGDTDDRGVNAGQMGDNLSLVDIRP